MKVWLQELSLVLGMVPPPRATEILIARQSVGFAALELSLCAGVKKMMGL